MPSTVVHLALAGLLAAGLLGRAFGPRAVAVVFAATAIPDLDVFAGLLVAGTHRAALHTLLWPALAALLVWWDVNREDSWLRGAYGDWGVRVAWVSILCVVVAGIGLDLVGAGANLLYPVVDQFYMLQGTLELSTQRGLVQTFVEFGESAGPKAIGSTQEVHIRSGVDPTRGAEPENVDRVFPVARSGWQLLLIVAGAIVVGGRLAERRP
jgi:hypothetical protein